ncbi:MAG TPA: hypothetical protein VMI72_08070, partial [Roseiarcus sp.]|nr:hypothetical protein [Roseiarcus sp.]
VLLEELLERDFSGWVVYMDADALIVNQKFDLHAYLADKAHYSGIFAHTGVTPHKWDINTGVLFLNLGTNRARKLVHFWYTDFMQLSEDMLRTASDWGSTIPSDQALLQRIFRESPELTRDIHYESASLINHTTMGKEEDSAAFICQILRNGTNINMKHRVSVIREKIDKMILGEEPLEESNVGVSKPIAELGPGQEALIVASLYHALLGRNPDLIGLNAYTNLLRSEGLEYGLPRALHALLESEEYRSRTTRN